MLRLSQLTISVGGTIERLQMKSLGFQYQSEAIIEETRNRPCVRTDAIGKTKLVQNNLSHLALKGRASGGDSKE